MQQQNTEHTVIPHESDSPAGTVNAQGQPFNRLVQKIDELKETSVITEDVVVQTGFSTYEPKYSKWQKLLPYQNMGKCVEQARIVITHGGSSSFIMPLQIGKIPIVVPRQSKFNEHVNDHQVPSHHLPCQYHAYERLYSMLRHSFTHWSAIER